MSKIKGIDVSKWQGTIDWAKVAGDGVKFAMIRLGYGSKDGTACKVDGCYQKNVENALANGIAVGCYFYSYALSVEAVKKEAAFVIQQLAKYKGRILYPIAFDIEDKTQTGLGKATLTEMVAAFCSALEAAGYYASFYCNVNWARNYLDMNALARYDLWLAQWASAPTYNGHTFNMWQSSSTGRVAGISGNVDMDTAYVDFEALIKQKKLNGYTGSTSGSSSSDVSTSDGDKLRQKVCHIINAWVGSTRGDKKHLEILNIYNNHAPLARGYKLRVKDAHCAATTSAAYIKAGIAKHTGTECSVEKFVAIAKKKGIWTESDKHVPGLGDACVYDWADNGVGDNTGSGDHIGIITEVHGSDSFVVTEGNMSGGKVGKRTMEVNGKYIRGFITPDFDEIAKEIIQPSKKLAPKVGDVVQFAGGPHYKSANASTKSGTPKAGPAKVTAISKGAKHPYHIVHTNNQSTVYGWVDADKVRK